MKKILKELKIFFKKMKENHIEEFTANCAYYTILAFIPLMMLILTLTKYVGLEQEKIFLIFSNFMPHNLLSDEVMEIIREVYAKSIGTITFSLLFTLWSAGKGFFALCKGLNVIYGIKESNPFMKFRLRAILSTVIFIVMVVLSLILLVFGNSIHHILQQKWNIVNQLVSILFKSKVFISILLLSIIFTNMYRFIPKHNYPLKSHIIGAVVAAIACNIISVFYAIYIDVFTGFSVMYGSLTTIVLAMMWVYGCMYSILLGAMINKIRIEKSIFCK